jgi:hypothetical protein
VAARAPDAGEDAVALPGKFPAGAVRAGILEHDGFTKFSEEAFLDYFANGIERKKAEVLYAGRHRRVDLRRANHSGGLAHQAILECDIEA